MLLKIKQKKCPQREIPRRGQISPANWETTQQERRTIRDTREGATLVNASIIITSYHVTPQLSSEIVGIIKINLSAFQSAITLLIVLGERIPDCS